MTPEDEVRRALDDMVRQGKVLYIGISDTPAWIVSRMNAIADLRGWSAFTALQIEYSLIQRTVERELVPMARALDLAVAAWAPLGGGALTGKYLNQDPERGRLKEGSVRLSKRNQDIAREVVAIAKEIGCSPVHVALRWLSSRPGVVIPIVGARTLEQFRTSLTGLEGEGIGAEHVKRLDDVSAIEAGFPHEFLASPPIRDIVYAGMRDAIDAHRPAGLPLAE